MPSFFPIRNGKLSNTLDFNNQGISNAATAKSLSISNIGDANYSLTGSDAFKILVFSTTGHTLTIGTNIDMPIGSEVLFYNTDAYVTIVDSGSTIDSYDGNNKTAGAYAVGCIIKTATNTWLATGNLATV